MHDSSTPERKGSPRRLKAQKKDELIARAKGYSNSASTADTDSWLADSRSPETGKNAHVINPEAKPLGNVERSGKASDSEDEFKLYTGAEMRSMFGSSTAPDVNTVGVLIEKERPGIEVKPTSGSFARPTRITNLLAQDSSDLLNDLDLPQMRSGTSDKSASRAASPARKLDAFFETSVPVANHIPASVPVASQNEVALQKQVGELADQVKALQKQLDDKEVHMLKIRSSSELDNQNISELTVKNVALLKENGVANQELAKIKQQLAAATALRSRRLNFIEQMWTIELNW